MKEQKQSTPITKEGLEGLGFKQTDDHDYEFTLGKKNLIGIYFYKEFIHIRISSATDDIEVPNCNTIEDLQTLINLFK